jgi:hypothetical protein
MYAEFVRIWAGSSIMGGMCGLIIERISASRKVEYYERISSPIFVSILILSSWGIGIVCTKLLLYCELKKCDFI